MQRRQHLHKPRHIGDRVADITAKNVGSWRFIIIQACILVIWIILNSLTFFAWKWDPEPFILLNLCLSFQAAFTAPIIMISQNRQAAKDKARDDVEAQEIQQLFDNHELLLDINEQQLAILKNQQEIVEKLAKT